MAESSQVQFPRFQYEEPATGGILKRKLVERAQPRPYLTGDQVDALIHPQTIVEAFSRDEMTLTNWWGVYHKSLHHLVIGDLFRPVSGSRFGELTLFRMWHILHTYLWDHQATDGKTHELVLEKIQFVSPKPFEEIAALRLNQREPEQQRLVVREEDGEWHEPKFGGIDIERDFSLQVMQALATRTLIDIVPVREGLAK